MLLVERWILARLRHHAFFRLGDLNAEIDTLLSALNRRPFRKLPGSRRTLFEQIDRPAMKPLPVPPYVFAEWRQPRVHIDYHVELDRHYYSVPYALVSHVVDARVTAHTVELFELAIARGDGRYRKLLAQLARLDVIILDDFGLAALTEEQRRDLLEILEDRYEVHHCPELPGRNSSKASA